MIQRLSFLLLIIVGLSGCKDDDSVLTPQIIRPDTETPVDMEVDTNDGRVPCVDGFAGEYPCDGYDLMAHFSLDQLNAEGNGNDSWGWTDPQTGKEYAIMGVRRGTVFIDISNPIAPVILGRMTTATEGSTWRDVKVYNNHAFVVSEAPNHGMQVFDLTRLRTVSEGVQDFTADAHYTEFGNAHNVVINENQPYAYVVGSQTFEGGPHFVDISDPKNPIAAGGFEDADYTHDAQVVTYNGPDTDYQGREIYFGSNRDEIVIIDVTDKNAPSLISRTAYSNVGFTHQGWLTEDHIYFLANDEFDESEFGFNTRTLIFNFADLDNPIFQGTFTGPTEAIDHNYYVKDNLLYIANYRAGVRIADLSGVSNNELFDIGFFDTFPENDDVGFAGAWNVYPFFASGNIIISDLQGGFFIIRKSGT